MGKYLSYTTVQGDTFDAIALDFYNDEFKAPIIAQANPQFSGVLAFDAGVKLQIPLINAKAAETLPPWRQGG